MSRKEYIGLVNDHGIECIGEEEPIVSNTGNKTRRLKCRCFCGNEIIVSAGYFKDKQSCGCKRDLTGKRFGRLEVLYETTRHPSGQRMWHCKCDCGGQTDTTTRCLTHGVTKSCGCLAIDLLKERSRKHNEFDLSGEYGVGYTSNGDKFLFDKDDYDKIKSYCWYLTSEGYVQTSVSGQGNIRMHWLVMGRKRVDHIRSDRRYDNRKANLRVESPGESFDALNARNRKVKVNNTSGVTGVSPIRGKWQASICIGGKQKYLGVYSAKEDAIAARKKAEEEYFGEWSYDNSQRTEV